MPGDDLITEPVGAFTDAIAMLDARGTWVLVDSDGRLALEPVDAALKATYLPSLVLSVEGVWVDP